MNLLMHCVYFMKTAIRVVTRKTHQQSTLLQSVRFIIREKFFVLFLFIIQCFFLTNAVQPVVFTKLMKLRVNIADFEVNKLIGPGHFREVHLVQEKQAGNEYAVKPVKVMKKEASLGKCDVSNILNMLKNTL